MDLGQQNVDWKEWDHAWEDSWQIEASNNITIISYCKGSCQPFTYIFTANSGNHIIGRSTQQFGNDRELVDVYNDAWCHVITCMLWWSWSFYLRSFPGNKGLPSSISAKIHPALQISTRWCTMSILDRGIPLFLNHWPATSYFCHVNMISGAR